MMQDQEIEVKFYIQDLLEIRHRLEKLGASLIHPRIFENNLRFDLPDGLLTQTHRVLRLRQDRQFRMTYKGPAQSHQPASIRQEIEFSISDFDAGRRLLEALGYHVSIRYEKYRTEYVYYDSIIALDEMPYGNFIEIEGEDVPAIQLFAVKLGLNWESRCLESYLSIFQRLREKLGLQAENLTFEAFSGIQISPTDLEIQPGKL
jgi:adenylate cyclase, class 2